VPEEMMGPDVYLLPLHMLAHGVSYQDKRTISFDRVKRLSGKLSSSQLNLEEIKQFLNPIVDCYDQVLVLTVSSRMSGLYDRYKEYLAQNTQSKVRLVDSRVNSVAEGLLALFASRRLREGAELDELADELESIRARTKIYVSLPNLKAMVASGRLNKNVGKVLQAIGFLPLVTISHEGEGAVKGLSFSRKRSDKLLLDKLEVGKVKEYAVVHVNDPQRAEAAAKAIRQKI
jgi:DegV family protein with EDD domain